MKDCIDCKHSFYEDLDNNLCCELKNNQILKGILDDEQFDDGIHCVYDYSYPNVCEHFELMEEYRMSEVLECLESMKNRLIDAKFTIEGTTLYSKDRNLDEDYRTIKQALIKSQEQEQVLKIVFEKPCESASTINYIKINKGNPKMLDYEHYCMTIKDSLRVNEQEFDLLKKVF